MKPEDFLKVKRIIEDECKYNEDNILQKSMSLSNLYSNILNVYIKELKNLKSLSLDKDKVYGELYHKYKYNYDYTLDSKSEIDVYVKSDDKYIQILKTYIDLEEQVKYLEQSLENINNIGFRIKNYIELLKISKGLV